MATLPPVLYWSPSLAEQLNERLGEDVRHGLIDFTDAEWPRHWIGDGEFWGGADGLPGDAVRLVADVAAPAEVRTEWGVRWAGDAPDGTDAVEEVDSREKAERVAWQEQGEVVLRAVRTGPWRAAP